MALSKETIAKEIEKKRQFAETHRPHNVAKLDSLTQQIQDTEYELSVVQDKLNAATEALFDKNAELDARRRAYESANRAIYNDLTASESQAAAMRNQLDNIKSSKNELEREAGTIISDMADRLSIYAANVTDTLENWRKATSKSVTIDDRTALETLIHLNPNVLMVIKDAAGGVHLLDNSGTTSQVLNDSLGTEKDGIVTPFRFVKPLKTIASNRGNVITTLDSLGETLSSYTRWAEQIPKGVTIEPSYGGVRLQIHKVGPSVTCWDENRTDYAGRMPTIVSAAGLIPHNFVVDGFLEVETSTTPLKRSEIIAMLNNNDTLLEQKSRFVVTDIMWLDETDCHAESLDSRHGKMNIFNGKYKHIVAGINKKVFTKQDTLDCICEMGNTPNASGAIMKHPDYMYGLGGTTTMAVEFAAKKTLNVKIIYSTTVSPEGGSFIHDCAVLDDMSNEVYVGKTDITSLGPDTQALKVEFKSIHEFIDPSTDMPHFNMIGAKTIDSVTLEEVSTVAETKGFADMDEAPVKYRAMPELGMMFTGMEEIPPSGIFGDCGCRNKTVSEEEPTIDVEFKLKEQMYKIVTDGKEHTKPIYHLLLQLPTKILDFTSTMNPLNQYPCTMERASATKMHWEVAGELPARHKLNDGKNQKSIIATLDQGHARITTGSDLNYIINLYIKGDYMDGMFELNRQNYATEAWTFSNSNGGI